jgi:hypothetical protein
MGTFMPYRSLLTALAICISSLGAAAAENPVIRGKESFLLSGNTTSRTLIGFATGKPGNAYVIAGPRPDRMLESVHPAADGLYVLARRGAREMLLRIPAQADGDMAPAMPAKIVSGCRNCRAFPVLRVHQISDIALPDGTITAILADPRRPGVSVVLERPAGRRVFHYDPSAGQFVGGSNGPLM